MAAAERRVGDESPHKEQQHRTAAKLDGSTAGVRPAASVDAEHAGAGRLGAAAEPLQRPGRRALRGDRLGPALRRWPGVESMVGLFINTVPVRVRVAGDQSLVTWLQTLQAEQLEVAATTSTVRSAKVQAWSEVPAGTPLFESLLVFENYPSIRHCSGEIRRWGSRGRAPSSAPTIP